MFRRRRIMAANDMGDWRELFDVALFEPNRVKLRQRIERANDAINTRIDALMTDQNENGGGISEYIALRDALTTLADRNVFRDAAPIFILVCHQSIEDRKST